MKRITTIFLIIIALGAILFWQYTPKKSRNNNKIFQAKIGEKDDLIKAKELVLRNDSKSAIELEQMLDSPSEKVRSASAKTLGIIQAKESFHALIQSLNDSSWQVRMQAARSLGKLGDKRAVDPLIMFVSDPAKGIEARATAILALGELKAKGATSLITEILEDETQDFGLQIAAIRAISTIGDSNSEPLVKSFLGSERREIRFNTIRTLGKIGTVLSIDDLTKIIRNDTEADHLRTGALISIGRIGGDKASSILVEMLNHQDEYIGMYAAKGLSLTKNTEAVPSLLSFLQRVKDPYVKESVNKCIDLLSDFGR